MEKSQLVNFIAKVLEESGFKVYKNFKTSQKVIDIYSILPTQIGDFGVVVACKNYSKEWEVGVDVLKEMEVVGRNLKAAKVIIVTSSTFSSQSKAYASKRNINLVDRFKLIALAKKFANKKEEKNNEEVYEAAANSNRLVPDYDYYSDDYYDMGYDNEGSSFYPSINSDSEDQYNYSPTHHSLYKTQVETPSKKGFFDRFRKSNKSTKQSPTPSRLPSSPRTSGLEKSSPKKSRGKTKPSPKKSRGKSNIISKPDSSQTMAPPLAPPHGVRNEEQKPSIIKPLLKRISSNTIFLIFVVVLASYLLAYVLGIYTSINTGTIGLIEMIVSLLLSYGLVFAFDKNGPTVLIKGTTVFFVSLIVLILLILLL